MAMVHLILLVATLVRSQESTAFGVAEEVLKRPLLEGTIDVPLDIEMPRHLNKMMKESVNVLEFINFQMGYLSELEYDIFSKRLKAMNITLSHLNNTLIEGIYHHFEDRSKRALLDIGGKLPQGIFGIANDINVKSIEDNYGPLRKKILL